MNNEENKEILPQEEKPEVAEPKARKLPKGAKVAIIVSASVVGFVGVFYLGVVTYFRAPVAQYYNNSQKAFIIPGINDGLIGQGLDYDAPSNNFVMCGYQAKGPSQIGIIDKGTGKTTKMLNLLNEDGSNNTCHAGGLTVHGEYLYLCHSGSGTNNSLDVYSWTEALSTNEKSIRAIGKISLALNADDYIKPSWTTDRDGKLIVGEFYRAGNYETNPLHHKGENKALAVEFAFDATKVDTFGLDLTPLKAYSLPGLVQGAAFDDDYMYLSTSYGPAFSHISFCDVYSKAAEGKVTVLGQEIDYVTATAKKTIKTPPMGEEIEIVDGWMYTMTEAASNKYIFGKFTGAQYCYATNLGAYKN